MKYQIKYKSNIFFFSLIFNFIFSLLSPSVYSITVMLGFLFVLYSPLMWYYSSILSLRIPTGLSASLIPTDNLFCYYRTVQKMLNVKWNLIDESYCD